MEKLTNNKNALSHKIEKRFLQAIIKEKEQIIAEWEKIDNQILKDRNKIWQVKDFKERTIWNPQVGIIKFKRRRYVNKITKEHKFLLDEKLKIPKRIFILPEHRALALFYYRLYQSYKEISLHLFKGYVSKMSVHRFIKEQQINFPAQRFKCDNDGILWINADGLWQKLHHTEDKSKIEIKNFCFFSGRTFQNNNKWKLEGRILKHFIEKPLTKIIEEVDKIAYSYEDVREIRVIGDRARWIKTVTKKLGATYYIDKFHIHKALFDLLDKESYYHGLKIITNGKFNKDRVRHELIKLMSDPETGEILKDTKKLGYIVNNRMAYLRSTSDNSRGVIEPMHSHYLAKFIKNRRKGLVLKY